LTVVRSATRTHFKRRKEKGALFDLHVSADSVSTGQFCDYLYTRVGAWRSRKSLTAWPWRGVIARGAATTEYLQGILTENYHYVRAAAIRQSPLLSHAASARQFDLIRGFVTGEASHERYFLETLTRWGIPASDVQSTVPLASTAGFISLQYRLAHKSLLDYLAGSAVLEVDPGVYQHQGDPYQPRASTYGIAPHILAPVREHIRDDVQAEHASLFRQIAEDAAPPPSRWKPRSASWHQRGPCSRPSGYGSATCTSTTSSAEAAPPGQPSSLRHSW
jgi:hypothetical protein